MAGVYSDNNLVKKCEDLIKQIEKDCDMANSKRKHLLKLEEISKKVNNNSFNNLFEEDDNDTLCEENLDDESSKYEEFVESYIQGYKDIDGSKISFEEILDFLPSRENGYFKDLVQRLIFESKKEISEWTRSSQDVISELSEEDLAFYYDYIDAEERKISLLRKALTYEPVVSLEKKQVENELILVPTPTGNIRIIEDIQHITPEYYPAFLELINSIKDGSFLGFKPLSNGAKYGLAEVKGFKVRVLFSRLKDNYYAVITAFVKKTDSDKLYRTNLMNRYVNFKMHEDDLIKKLDDSSFLEENELQVQELYNILGADEKKEYKRGGLNG